MFFCMWSEKEGIVEDLRRVNEWLDHICMKRKRILSMSKGVDDQIGSLKQRLYEFLIQLCLHKPVALTAAAATLTDGLDTPAP